MGRPSVAVLDSGSGNIRSVQRALERVGAEVHVTSEPADSADGLVVPGVGAYATCMRDLAAVGGDRMVADRLADERPVLGICVGMQVMFEAGEEHGVRTQGLGLWPGVVERLQSAVVPHSGWNTVSAPTGSDMFAGAAEEWFYFVHSYAVRSGGPAETPQAPVPGVTWTGYGDDRFVSAVEDGPLWATQFHPEKSGDAGAALLRNWLDRLR
jgi:glutamine amidotransferase